MLKVNEAALYSIARGFLALETAGRTGGEIARLKLLGDPDIYMQPGQQFEALGHRLRGLMGQLVAVGVVDPATVSTLLSAAAESVRFRGLDTTIMVLTDNGEEPAAAPPFQKTASLESGGLDADREGWLAMGRRLVGTYGVEAGSLAGAFLGSGAGGIGAVPGAALGGAVGEVLEEFAQEE